MAGKAQPSQKKYDIVIVGGGVIGSSAAYWLTENPDFDGSILVVERDWTYRHASTTLSTGSIRQQFSNPINVKISQFGATFLKDFHNQVAVDDVAPEIGFHERGYLLIADEQRAHVLRENYTIQHELGAGTMLLSRDDITAKFPFINASDITLGSWGRHDEGWFDPNALLQGFRTRARRNGAEYIENEVIAIDRAGPMVAGIQLTSGETIACGTVINAAGPRCTVLANMAGLDIPVEPRKRCTFVFDCREPIVEAMPLVIDLTGVWCRPEGQFYMAAACPENDCAVDVDDFEVLHDQFTDAVWPALAHRIPQFEAIKVVNSWVGHYAFCTLDHNAIVGPHNEVKNFYFANGYSGHGLQQSPAVGRCLSELIIYGQYRTLDLSPLSYDRVVANEPFLENEVI